MSRTSAVVELPHRTSTVDDSAPSFEELMGMVQYNQGLVEFADSKAGSLILLNSLLIAAVAALPNNGNTGLLKLASMLVASCAVFLCFQVISSRAGSSNDSDGPLVPKRRGANWQADDFLFFASISQHKTGDDYARAFAGSHPDARRAALLQRTYVIAGIAQRKFAQYAAAQKVTTAAMAVWVGVNLLPFLAQ